MHTSLICFFFLIPTGLITLLQRPQRHFKFSNGSTAKKLSVRSCVNILAATLSNSSSRGKSTRGKKLPGQTFCGTLEHGFVIEPKDDELTLLQGDLWKKIDAFYRFSRPHTVIGTVSDSFFYLDRERHKCNAFQK